MYGNFCDWLFKHPEILLTLLIAGLFVDIITN